MISLAAAGADVKIAADMAVGNGVAGAVQVASR